MLSNPSDFRNAEAPGGVSLSSQASIAAKPGDARFFRQDREQRPHCPDGFTLRLLNRKDTGYRKFRTI